MDNVLGSSPNWTDELYPGVLKELGTELGPVFTHLFRQSIYTGDIPKGMVSRKYLSAFQEKMTGHFRAGFLDLCAM